MFQPHHLHDRRLLLLVLLTLTILSQYQPSAVEAISLVSTINSLRNKMGQGISVTQWYVHGRKHFTKTGYDKHVKQYYKSAVQNSASIIRGAEGADGVDMEGKVVVVTGANSGLGKELATYAAAKGATLYMLCRSPDRAEAAKKEISELTNNDNISILLADVGELSQVRKVVAELQAKETTIDCLVCNAGVLLNDRKETTEGNEMTFASHFLGGSYLLSQLLLPQLKAAKEPRCVFVTSGGMLITKFPDWETVTSTGAQTENYDGQFAYGYAKRGQVLLAERLTKEEPEIKWATVHPGWAGTNAVEDAFGENKKYLEPLRSTWEGAEGITWLMQTESSNIESGALYLDRKAQKKHIAGAFMTEGSYTKNKPADVDEMMKNLKAAAGL